MGFDETGRWHQARLRRSALARREPEENLMAPARGIIYGLMLSGFLWTGIVATGKLLLRLF